MSVPLTLSLQGEEVWQSLRYHVEWAEGFALIFLFSSNAALYGLLRERLANIYQTRVSHLQQIIPASAATVTEDVMALIRTPSELHEHAVAPLWLDLTPGRGPTWEQARDNVMARLNEHRELLRQRIRRPVIIVLPAGYRQRLRELAPDMWSIRDFSLDLDEREMVRQVDGASMASNATQGVRYHIASPEAYVDLGRDMTGTDTPSSPATLFNEAQWLEWERLQQSGATSREVVWAGWRATDAALSARQLQQAAQIAVDVLKMTQALKGQQGDTPETVRDLSVSLNRVGDVAGALGRLEDAEAAYRESLALRREQRQRLGDTPETVRDLSVSLDRVGDVARALGRLEEARTHYHEACILYRRLDLAFPGRSEYQQAIAALEQKLAAAPPPAATMPT